MRLKQALIAFDQFLNTLAGGWADETLSARAWREQWPSRAWIDRLFFFDPNHCQMSFESERLRLQSPPEERACPTKS